MRLYDCKVLLSGSRENEVRKTDISAAEVMILQRFHGVDAVLDIVPKEMDKRTHADERRRLFTTYVGADEATNLGGHQKERAAVLTNLFGPMHAQLPVELPKVEAFADEADLPAPVRAKVPVKAGKAENVAADMTA